MNREEGHARLEAILSEIAEKYARIEQRGEVASYIPELARINLFSFGVAVVTADGQEYVSGDADTLFSIQSISKVFSLAIALEVVGDKIWRRVGREPSGSAFNSIVQLEHEKGIPRNPFINSGALVTTDILMGNQGEFDPIDELLAFIRNAGADQSISIDPKIAQSEFEHPYTNTALASFIKAHGNLQNDVDAVLKAYFNACAISMSCRQLARAGRFLAWEGRVGPKGARISTEKVSRIINTLMLTCGHYDGSGDFAYRVGIPGKSGVGGGILAIVPGKASIAAWSPGLDAVGNSVLATRALQEIAKHMNWSLFATN